jgi:hypothetical protein
LRGLNVVAPNSFLTGAALYFVFGLAAFGWIQQERMPLPLSQTLLALLAGDIFFIALLMVAGGSTGAPLAHPLIPQLAAGGWLLRTQTAFFHAALAQSCCSRSRPGACSAAICAARSFCRPG